jgi:hypothetical protein
LTADKAGKNPSEKGGVGMKKRVTIAVFISWVLLFLVEVAASPAGAFASEGRSFIFPEITGWKLSGEIQTFAPKTLYEYINGAADLYQAYDFQELTVAEYLNDRKASVTVEIYRHKSANDAFGIYSQERAPDANYLSIGAQGYHGQHILNCVSGNYYIKLNSYDTGTEDLEVLQVFARKVVETLGENGRLPALLGSFPEEGKIEHSEKFIARNFLGYSFLNPAFTADYDLSGKKFKLFYMECRDRDECGNVMQQYLGRLKKPDQNVAEHRYTLADPHHGVVDLFWRGKSIWGVLDLAEADLRSRYLDLFGERLANRK